MRLQNSGQQMEGQPKWMEKAEGGSIQVTPAEEAHLLQLKMFQTSSMNFSPLETIQMLLFRPSVFAEGLNIV